MIRTFNETNPPANLITYLDRDTAATNAALRRRSILVHSPQDEWLLALSVVEAFPDLERIPRPQPSHHYGGLILCEDWLSHQGARSFVDDVQAGKVILDNKTLTRTSGATWQSEYVAPPNPFMNRIGFVFQTRFETRPINLAQEPLISVEEPYYPDAASALQDWAGLIQHHGYNDARNGHVIFMLPEARAFFTEAISDNGVLHLTLAGSEVCRSALIVKGAYWLDGKIHHVEARVTADHVELSVPNEVERLEYVLLGVDGQMYDLQREGWGQTAGLARGRSSRTDDALVQQILEAQEAGEGDTIEFKPFIHPDQPLGGVREKGKFREILRSIAAFANTSGGRIFLGIRNDCSLNGIEVDLAKWQNAEVSEEICNRYRGALTSKIRDDIVGDCRFGIAFSEVGGATIAVLAVSRFETEPVGLKDEGLCYVRRGSSNRSLAPHEWRTIFGQS